MFGIGWEGSYLVAVSVLAVPTVLAFLLGGGSAWFTGLVCGADNRWSTSKMGVILWTYGVFFALISILVHTRGLELANQSIQQEYLVVLGIPSIAAAGASAITQSKVAVDPAVKPSLAAPTTNLLTGIGQLFSTDAGQPDILDTQYLGFNVLLLAWFLVTFVDHSQLGLPNLPDSLVGLTGVGAAGYLAKKAIQPTG